MHRPMRALVSWFRASDEEYIERVRRGIAAYDRWRRLLLAFYALAAIVLVGFLVLWFGSWQGQMQQLSHSENPYVGLGFLIGLAVGTMSGIMVIAVINVLGNLLFGLRGERLMIRYHDALQGSCPKLAEEPGDESSAP